MFETTEIFLSDKAFMSIILSAIEVYKKECIGVLLGYRTSGRIIVEYAIPFQAADRSYAEVSSDWRAELKLAKVLPKLIQMQKLGYFHSHPQFGTNRGFPSLSEQDEKLMREVEVEIVVAINDRKIKVPWSETKKGLSGTLGGYYLVIAGFYKRKDGEIKRFRILCPYAVGFDFAFKE